MLFSILWYLHGSSADSCLPAFLVFIEIEVSLVEQCELAVALFNAEVQVYRRLLVEERICRKR